MRGWVVVTIFRSIWVVAFVFDSRVARRVFGPLKKRPRRKGVSRNNHKTAKNDDRCCQLPYTASCRNRRILAMMLLIQVVCLLEEGGKRAE